jgi:large subunit ribosomal protein L29
MLAKDIREMSEADINARIAELERERFNLVIASGTRTLDDPLRLRVIRRDIARLRTVLREKVIGIAEAGGGTGEAGSEKREAVTARRVTGRRGRKAATATNRKKTSKRA